MRAAQQANLKPVKNIAGFVSAPWENVRGSGGSPVLMATTLVGEVGFEGNKKSRKKVPGALTQSLDKQLLNKHAEEMMALSPAVGTLLQRKLITSPSRGTTRTKTKKGKGTAKSISSKDDLLMTECLTLAATQAELQSNIDRQVKEHLMQVSLMQ